MPYVDFAALKQRLTIEKTAELLGLTLKQTGQTYRGPCPACGSGGDRALVITPTKQVWYCWVAHVGGDLIALTAHIRKCEAKEAAAWLDRDSPSLRKEQSTEPGPPKGNSTLQPLDLEYDHPAVAALGFDPVDAQQLGIGYAGKGIMRGLVAVPIRLVDGTLAGYIGVEEVAKLPPRWQGLAPNVTTLKRPA